MTAAEARQVSATIRLWPPNDRAWWRELLEIAPDEAVKIAPLILLGAYPADGRGAKHE